MSVSPRTPDVYLRKCHGNSLSDTAPLCCSMLQGLSSWPSYCCHSSPLQSLEVCSFVWLSLFSVLLRLHHNSFSIAAVLFQGSGLLQTTFQVTSRLFDEWSQHLTISFLGTGWFQLESWAAKDFHYLRRPFALWANGTAQLPLTASIRGCSLALIYVVSHTPDYTWIGHKVQIVGLHQLLHHSAQSQRDLMPSII